MVYWLSGYKYNRQLNGETIRCHHLTAGTFPFCGNIPIAINCWCSAAGRQLILILAVPIYQLMLKRTGLVLLLAINSGAFAQQEAKIHLWPTAVPGEPAAKHEPIQGDTKGNVLRLSDITDPAFLVFEPKKAKRNGAGVIVCPGGGYQLLAMDLEGTEIARWLNELGYVAFVLQYRVPSRKAGALQDIQRAMGLIRSNAERWKLDPEKLGVMGFSAGGSLCARLSTNFGTRKYTPVDAADSVSCRPAFTLLIYPAFLDQGPAKSLTPEIQVTSATPPAFIFQTADDPHGNSSLVMASALRFATVPVELHVLPKGGHGYGLRPGNAAAAIWPALARQWLDNSLKASNKPK
jgi:acetyl esterase/lipase